MNGPAFLTGRAFSTMGVLFGVPQVAALPTLDWRIDGGFGAIGVARGTDGRVRAAVRAWADAFGAEVVADSCQGPTLPGWIVAHLLVTGLGVTVGGVLREIGEVAW